MECSFSKQGVCKMEDNCGCIAIAFFCNDRGTSGQIFGCVLSSPVLLAMIGGDVSTATGWNNSAV
jgi:hypothetical protein